MIILFKKEEILLNINEESGFDTYYHVFYQI